MNERNKRTASITARVPSDLKKQVELSAREDGITVSDVVNDALKLYLEQRQGK